MTQSLSMRPAVADPDLAGVFDAVSDAHRSVGYEAGYRRAANDLLADLALLAAEVGREHPEARGALRTLRQRLEHQIDGTGSVRPPSADGYVSGGLGI